MGTLTQVAADRRAQLMTHVDGLPALADRLEASDADAAERLAAEHDYLVRDLIPLMATVEATFYPELDRLMSCRLGMTPLEREHEEIGELLARLGRARATGGATEPSERAELARTIRRLHDITSRHLREEARYVPLLEHNLSRAERAPLVAAVERPTPGLG